MADTLGGLLAQSFVRYQDHAALVLDGRSLSYGQLWDRASSLATTLGTRRMPRTLGLHVTKGLAAYVGYLSALQIGATVVPLNPRLPRKRLRWIAAASNVDAVLTDEPEVRWYDVPTHAAGGFAEQAVTASVRGARPRQLAYVMFTSGSTGTPKGVPVSDVKVLHYLDCVADILEVDAGSRVTQTFALSFDPSVLEILLCWRAGAALIPASERHLLDPVRYVNDHEVTHWLSVPSVATYARRMRMLQPGVMPSIRMSGFIGEQLALDAARHWRSAAANTAVLNMYGPTELTITCTSYRLPDNEDDWPKTPNGSVPIGQLHPMHDYRIVGDNGMDDVVGELWVRGRQRFDGYVDAGDNAGAFVNAAPDTAEVSPESWYRTGDKVAVGPGGDLVHLGRIDRQVKVRGYRVELAELEAALRSSPGIIDAVACQLSDGNLGCLVVGDTPDAAAIKQELGDRVPFYMMPTLLTWQTSIPCTTSAKTDYAEVRRILEARRLRP